MAPMLPKLFFLHFEGTSFVAENDDGTLAAFLIGFLSQTDAEEAYIHFVGVAPDQRGSGIGRRALRALLRRRARRRAARASVASPRRPTRDRSRSTSRSDSPPRASPRTTTARAKIACCSSSSSASDGPHTGFTEPRLVSAGCPTSFSRRPVRPAAGVAAGRARRSCLPSSSWSWLRPWAAWRCPSARRFLPGRRSPGSTSVG